MKNHILFTTLLTLFTFSLLFAQAPAAFNYQGVARLDGDVVTDNLDLRLSLRKGSPNGPVIFQESFTTTPNPQGQFSVQWGLQKPGLDTINWSEGPYFQQVEIQTSSTGGFVDMGTTQLLSVPYAMYAKQGGPWLIQGDTLLRSGQRDLTVEGILDLQGDLKWYSGKNIQLVTDSTANPEFSFDFPDGDSTKRWSIYDPKHGHIFTVRNSGRVGVGYSNPQAPLHILDSDITLAGGGGLLIGGLGGPNLCFDRNEIMARDNGTEGTLALQAEGGRIVIHSILEEAKSLVITEEGALGIGVDNPDNESKLHVKASNKLVQVKLERTGNNAGASYIGGSGDGFIVGHFEGNNFKRDFTVSHEGQAECNTLKINGSDIIERTYSSQDLQPGEVIVIDPTNPNYVKRSTRAYDPKVIGVVSGAGGVKHGMELSQPGVLDGNVPFAIAGRVYVRVAGKVEPGDLLTTSHIPGKAMKAKNRRKREGAVIGKALTSPNEEGMVLILVIPN